MSDFKRRHFQGEVILWAVRWYCRYRVSLLSLMTTPELLAAARAEWAGKTDGQAYICPISDNVMPGSAHGRKTTSFR
ncbi:hypothetical protein HGP16_33215 [Rhizobium sp. P40RR-XXII]|nr:hypothetical protein [Rhizobium sp. P40RR-XXII]